MAKIWAIAGKECHKVLNGGDKYDKVNNSNDFTYYMHNITYI